MSKQVSRDDRRTVNGM